MIRRPPRSTLFPTRRSSDLLVPAMVEKAVASLREVVRLNPNDAEGWALLGEFYFGTDRVNEAIDAWTRSEEHTSELQSRQYLVCRLLLEKKKTIHEAYTSSE